MKKVCMLFLVLGLVQLISLELAHSQEKYPNRAIELVVPYSMGGSNDVAARIINDKLARIFKVPVNVINDDVITDQTLDGLDAEHVVTDAGDEGNGPASPRSSNRLVRTLAARGGGEPVAENRLPRRRHVRRANDQVHVDRPDDQDCGLGHKRLFFYVPLAVIVALEAGIRKKP